MYTGESQKGVMISHRNVIANTLQISTFEKPMREEKKDPKTGLPLTDVALGLLPQSHIYVGCLDVRYRRPPL